jgi:signal transduction histidine kinase
VLSWQFVFAQMQTEPALDSAMRNLVNDALIKNELEVAKMRMNYELLKQQDEIALLQKDNQLMKATTQKQILIIIVAVSLIIFLTALSFVLYFSNAKAQKLNALLEKQRKELEDKNEEIHQQKEEIEAINNSLELSITQHTKQLHITVESLSQRNKDLEQFSYIVSHNLRAPIAHLIGLANIFNKEVPEDPMNQEILTHVQKAACNLDVIVKDLTHILSIRNNLSLQRERINLPELTQEVLEKLKEEIRQASPQISLHFNQVRYIYSVKSHIENILLQLISNALKYRKKRVALQIKIEAIVSENNQFCLIVKDNGLGIDLTKVDPYKIFGLYQRMHTHVDGKGLGLYLVKTQVEALGGKVEVESEENIGSTFKVILPFS